MKTNHVKIRGMKLKHLSDDLYVSCSTDSANNLLVQVLKDNEDGWQYTKANGSDIPNEYKERKELDAIQKISNFKMLHRIEEIFEKVDDTKSLKTSCFPYEAMEEELGPELEDEEIDQLLEPKEKIETCEAVDARRIFNLLFTEDVKFDKKMNRIAALLEIEENASEENKEEGFITMQTSSLGYTQSTNLISTQDTQDDPFSYYYAAPKPSTSISDLKSGKSFLITKPVLNYLSEQW
jgi:hypothetical protein